jgi:hypothetical protein
VRGSQYVGALTYGRPMLTVAIIATAAAALSGWAAWRSAAHAKATVEEAKRSADAAEASLAEARRSADAAERAAGAAMVTAEADQAADHRAREPRLIVTVENMVEHDASEAIFRVLNNGPVDLESVIVHRPILGEVEGRVRHQVAHTGVTDYASWANLGPIAVTEYERFTLSLGIRDELPEFRIRMVCSAGDESWPLTFLLDHPRKTRPVLPRSAGGLNSATQRGIMDMGF